MEDLSRYHSSLARATRSTSGQRTSPGIFGTRPYTGHQLTHLVAPSPLLLAVVPVADAWAHPLS